MKTRRRYDELDGYRGLAALGVVLFHATANAYAHAPGTPALAVLRNLDLGVDLFFALSGFVIFLPFARAALAGGSPVALGAFAIRRARRLLPLYWTLILGVWLVRGGRTPADWRDVALHLTMLQLTDPRTAGTLIGPAWSLACEAWYYVLAALVGVLLAAGLRRCTPRRRLAVALLVPLGLTLAGLAYSALPGVHDYAPPFRVPAFAMGMALALLAAARVTLTRRAVWLLRLGAPLLTLPLLPGRDPWAGGLPSAVVHAAAGLSCAALFASTVLAAEPSRLARVLASRPLALAGALSYGVYLWHEPLLIAARDRGAFATHEPRAFALQTALLALAALTCAAVTYRYLERPCLRAGRTTGRAARVSAPALPIPDPA